MLVKSQSHITGLSKYRTKRHKQAIPKASSMTIFSDQIDRMSAASKTELNPSYPPIVSADQNPYDDSLELEGGTRQLWSDLPKESYCESYQESSTSVLMS